MNFRTGSVLLTLVALSPCVNAAQAVFANGLEVASKSASVVMAFPDVSFTSDPDWLPVGAPIPYPSSGMIVDKERGNTAAQRTLPRVLRHGPLREEEPCETRPVEMQRHGGLHFERYSFDVEFEQPAEVRLPDLPTRNHR